LNQALEFGDTHVDVKSLAELCPAELGAGANRAQVRRDLVRRHFPEAKAEQVLRVLAFLPGKLRVQFAGRRADLSGSGALRASRHPTGPSRSPVAAR
jgi:hypothetical protein